jgi:transcriptional regulator with XRE-family HTH domain
MGLAEKLKYYRKKQGLSQEHIADRLNLSRQAISKWENGHTAPDIENLVRLSNIYKVSIDELLQEKQLPEKEIPNNSQEPSVVVKDEMTANALENGFSLLVLAILSSAVYPVGVMLIPLVLWHNKRSNSFYKLIYATCLFSILLNIHTTYAHLTDIFNWGITMVERIE